MENNENEEQKFISRNLLFKNDPETEKYKKNSPKHPKNRRRAFPLQKVKNNKFFGFWQCKFQKQQKTNI